MSSDVMEVQKTRKAKIAREKLFIEGTGTLLGVVYETEGMVKSPEMLAGTAANLPFPVDECVNILEAAAGVALKTALLRAERLGIDKECEKERVAGVMRENGWNAYAEKWNSGIAETSRSSVETIAEFIDASVVEGTSVAARKKRGGKVAALVAAASVAFACIVGGIAFDREAAASAKFGLSRFHPSIEMNVRGHAEGCVFDNHSFLSNRGMAQRESTSEIHRHGISSGAFGSSSPLLELSRWVVSETLLAMTEKEASAPAPDGALLSLLVARWAELNGQDGADAACAFAVRKDKENNNEKIREGAYGDISYKEYLKEKYGYDEKRAVGVVEGIPALRLAYEAMFGESVFGEPCTSRISFGPEL